MLSILIPCKDSSYLPTCFHSLDQMDMPWDEKKEILLFASSQKVADVASKLQLETPLRFWTGDCGVAEAYNFLSRQATGRLLMAHSDMVFHKSSFLRVWPYLKENCVTSMLCFEPPFSEKTLNNRIMELTDPNGVFRQGEFDALVEAWSLDGAISQDFSVPWLISRKEFKQVGGYDSRLSDFPTDFACRAWLHGLKFQQIHGSVVYHFMVQFDEKSSQEGKARNVKGIRDFVRKWRTHPSYFKVNFEVPPLFRTVAFLSNTTPQLLYDCEPFFDTLYSDRSDYEKQYLEGEDSQFDLHPKFEPSKLVDGATVRINGLTFDKRDRDALFLLHGKIGQIGPYQNFDFQRMKIQTVRLENRMPLERVRLT